MAISQQTREREREREKQNGRSSNFELMRIVAVVFIVIYHVVDQAFRYCHLIKDTKYFLCPTDFPFNRFFVSSLDTLGEIGNLIFFALTGFFMIKSTAKFSKAMKIYFQVFFYAAITTIVVIIAKKTGVYDFPEWSHFYNKVFPLITNVIPITSECYWFVTTYMVLYLISPAINFFLKKMNKRIFKTFLFISILFWFLPRIFGFVYSRLQYAVVFYCIGAYIRLYHYKKEENGTILFLIVAITSILLNCFVMYQSNKYDIWEGKRGGVYKFIARNSFKALVLFLQGVSAASIFLFFKSIYIPHNKIINKIASCSLGVYLLHIPVWVARPLIWTIIFNVPEYYKSVYFPVIAFLIMLAIYGAGIIVDLFRQRFFAPITDGITEHIIRHYKAIRSEGQDKPQECSSTH